MRESIPSEESFGSYDLFVEDLDRWRQLAVHPHQQELFDEIASAIWGKRESLTETPNFLGEQSEDRDRLYQMIKKLVERFSVESSLPLSILENVDDFWDYDHPSDSTSITLFQSRNPHNVEWQSSDIPHDAPSAESAANQDHDATIKDLRESSGWKPGLLVFLMMGAIFACIISFMFALQTGSPFVAVSRYISAQLDTYWGIVHNSLTKLPSGESVYLKAREEFNANRLSSLKEIRSFISAQAQAEFNVHFKALETEIRHASTPVLIYLEGVALQNRYALTELFLYTLVMSDSHNPSATNEWDVWDEYSRTTSYSSLCSGLTRFRPADQALTNDNLLSSNNFGRRASLTSESPSSMHDLDSLSSYRSRSWSEASTPFSNPSSFSPSTTHLWADLATD